MGYFEGIGQRERTSGWLSLSDGYFKTRIEASACIIRQKRKDRIRNIKNQYRIYRQKASRYKDQVGYYIVQVRVRL